MSAKILIVEDEPLIALGLEQDLEDDGFEVAGIAETVEKAIRLVEAGGFDAAILDGNLFEKSSRPVAELLIANSIPYVVVTGYSSGQIGDWIKDAPRLSKPYDKNELIAEVRKLLP